MARKFDIILFGATGFTGKWCIPSLHKLANADGRSLSWAVAGRSASKLSNVLEEMGAKLETDLSAVPLVIADVSDAKSLQEMANQARIIINTCGPYRFYGEPVVKACVEASTHHVDVSGEPQYMERMQLEYGKAAQEKGVYVVSACGFDSIPTDLGVVYMEDKFGGTINSVETYLKVWTVGSYSGAAVNYGTWESAVYGLAHANELRSLRSQLYPTRMPTFQPRLKHRAPLHKNGIMNGEWCAPFPGSDRSVVMRSQRYLYDNDKKRPVQMTAYVSIGSFVNVILMAIFGGIFALFARFSVTRKLLLNYPSFFSFGQFSKEGPSEEKVKNMKFSITFNCVGWKDKTVSNPNEEIQEKPDKQMIGIVEGVNPGYGATCTALTLSAIVILEESDKMPDKGGVFPPGAAFAKTSIIKQLDNNDMKFKILKSTDI